MSKRVRALAASVLALAMLIPMFSMAQAQTQPEPYPGTNKFCITGTIINFDEKVLDDEEPPWEVTATQIDPQGAAVVDRADDGKFEFEDLAPGVWRVSVTLPVGWEPVPPYGTSFDVTLDYGNTACVNVRFKVRRPIAVEVLKIDDNHVPLADWVIHASPADGNWFASPITATTDGNGIAAFRLTEGKWVFTETPPSGQHYKPVMPYDGKQELDVKWDDNWPPEGGKISIRFKNRLYFKGCIAVTKTDAPPDTGSQAYGLPDWKITVTRTDGSIAAQGYTDALGNARFSNLPYGPYIVTEEKRTGWESVGTTSYEVTVSRPQTDSPDNAGCELVDFINRQVPPGYSIEGYKIDHNGMIGIPGWIMTATAVYKGDYPDPNVDFDPISLEPMSYLTTTTDGTGKYVFTFPMDDYRVPGAAYKICEEQRAGWLPHTSTCQTVYLPTKPGHPVKAWDFVNQQVGHWESITHPSSSSSSGSGCSTTHVVSSGESLYGIGAYYGVSASAMLAANPWVYNRPNYYVYPGDVVCIP
jgi:hypothetical protein